MLDQIKKYKDIIFLGIIISVSLYCISLFVGKKILQVENNYLQKQEKQLMEVVNELKVEIGSMKQLREQDLAANKESALRITKLETELKNAKKPVVIEHPKTDEQVVAKIGTLYNDNTTRFNSSEFLIKKSTTFGMVYDAEQWKVNGPILTDNLNKSLALNSEYRIGIDLRDKTIEHDTKLIGTLEESGKVKDQIIDNKDKQNVNITRQLNLEQKSGKMKAVGGFISGLLLYYVQDKLRKKK